MALGTFCHVADTAEGALELGLLAAEDQLLLLGEADQRAGLLEVLELLEALQPLVHGLEVGEHAAQPALVDVGHADARGLLGDDFLRLTLGADEQDRAAVGDRLLDELVGVVDVPERLLQVDDVDAVALGEDEALHLRVPATGLVPEVDAAVEQLLHADDCHGASPVCARPVAALLGSSRAPGGAPPWRPAAPHTRRLPAGTEVATAPLKREEDARSRPVGTGRTGKHTRAPAPRFSPAVRHPQIGRTPLRARRRAQDRPHARPPPAPAPGRSPRSSAPAPAAAAPARPAAAARAVVGAAGRRARR